MRSSSLCSLLALSVCLGCGKTTGSNAASGGSGGSIATGGSAPGGSGGGAGAVGAAGGATAMGGGGAGGAPPKIPGPKIVVDQFGYRTNAEKIAVIRSPQTGWDSWDTFTPGTKYALVDSQSSAQVLTAAPTPWNSGATDSVSGDKAWWFDFSSVTTAGKYYVEDVDNGTKSDEFSIADDVYHDVLRAAVKMFYYQRANFPKDAQYAGVGWADAASHLGPLQDSHCRLFSAPTDASTERDLHGAWYDAGDYNKYTNWTASYVVELLRAYNENPSVFTDDFGIPESGNGLPDLIDEVKWGMDWLVRMQQADGSVLSIVGLDSASPPSAATGQSLYGSASTSATLSTATAFAYGYLTLHSVTSLSSYADDLLARAQKAYAWAVANPAVRFSNNSSRNGSTGLGAGQQEVGTTARTQKKIAASVYLFEATGDTTYRDFVDQNYTSVSFLAGTSVSPFQTEQQTMLLDYAKLANATPTVASAILAAYRSGMNATDALGSLTGNSDPYLAFMNASDYTWGSNHTKSSKGNTFYAIITYGLDSTLDADAARTAERYVHYVHGVNPFGLVYLSNMSGVGAERSVNEFYHTWFTDGSAKWDRVGVSTYGPPPGFLTGGPNPSYAVDACCPSTCGSDYNNSICTSLSLVPPENQPPEKSYKDFNTSWPLNSWQITEPSDGYQVAYIRLVSKFVH